MEAFVGLLSIISAIKGIFAEPSGFGDIICEKLLSDPLCNIFFVTAVVFSTDKKSQGQCYAEYIYSCLQFYNEHKYYKTDIANKKMSDIIVDLKNAKCI